MNEKQCVHNNIISVTEMCFQAKYTKTMIAIKKNKKNIDFQLSI